MKELIKNFIEEKAVDEGFLQDWYRSSVDDRDNPIWTDEHIAEVCGDFYLIPKESVEKLDDVAKDAAKFNEDEKILIGILQNAKRYVKGELELDLVDGMWIAMDYRKDLEGAFPIDTKEITGRIISKSEAKALGINVQKCCDECNVLYVG